MRLARLLAFCAVVAAIALLSSGGVNSQEKKDATPKLKGQLPSGWPRLGLTDEQKQEVFKLQDEHKRKVGVFKEQIAFHDAELVKGRLGVLTDEQRRKMRELYAENKLNDDHAKDKGKEKNQLPIGWSKLDLTDKQKEDLLKLFDEHKTKVDGLKEQIAKLDAELVKGRLNVLTEDQRKKLRDSVGGDPPPKDKK
jgi:Spy/CpxP family protein refolding chaperone